MSFFVVLFILSPVFVLIILIYNPNERFLIAKDNKRREIISILSRSLEDYFVKNGFYPESLNYLQDIPICIDCEYLRSINQKEAVLFIGAESLRLTEYCNGRNTFILYSSKSKRTGIVCEYPEINNIEFVN